jgi:hypothetical protein
MLRPPLLKVVFFANTIAVLILTKHSSTAGLVASARRPGLFQRGEGSGAQVIRDPSQPRLGLFMSQTGQSAPKCGSDPRQTLRSA